jgi:transglutaminase-like putative cysteine protease
MLLHIRHETCYQYDHPVNYSIQNLRLTPRNEGGQRLRDWRIATPGRRRVQTDAYGNLAHTMTLDQLHDEIRIFVEGWIETDDAAGPWIEHDGRLPVLAFLQETPLTTPDASARRLSAQAFGHGHEIKLALIELMAEIEDRIDYQPGATDVTSTAAEALARGAGVCQDHAHVMIACARAAGLPARYVSGYLYTGDDGHLASHAWADVWDGHRWVSCDATHRAFAGASYCRLAVGRDYLDACPVRGMRRGGGAEGMSAVVHVLQVEQ